MNHMTVDTPDAPWNDPIEDRTENDWLRNEFIDKVDESFTDDFFEDNHEWIKESVICFNWMLKSYNDFKDPEETAKIIERAYKIYSL